MRTAILTTLLLVACSAADDPPLDTGDDDGVDDPVDPDGDADFDVSDRIESLAPAATRHVYGTTPQGQSLVYYKLAPAAPNGKRALITFGLHGFEDAWKQDGRALFSIAHEAIAYYGNDPSRLHGWTVYIVPTANPDGMRFGINNWREGSGAYGRCTSLGKDINRHVSEGTSREQRALRALFDDIDPTIAIDVHGWYNTYYGDSTIGGYFQRSFNAAYDGKPARYCFVSSTGAMDCGATLGGVFHGTTSIGHDLFVEWAMRERGVPAALVEYPAPDFNLNGVFDSVWDAELGYRRMGKNTLAKLWGRTRVALDNLFANE
ncbi:MAG TPA: M14 family zinc carboxypeptidase [Kofleriaceae bacterium]|nr:M14 family zinc carboxypeptidase [Kofleriaceae bacterium]